MSAGVVRGRIPALDGARGFGALIIVTVHAVDFLGPAYVAPFYPFGEAVVFFFALSGFLIHLPFARAIETGRRLPSLRSYTGHRARRIFPGWIAAFLVANLALAAVYLVNRNGTAVPRSDAGTGRITEPDRILEHLSLVANLLPSEIQTGITPSWSLTTELCFYFLLPVLAWLTLRRGRQPSLARVLAPGAVLLAVGLAGVLWSEHLIATHELGTALGRFGPNFESVLSRSILVQGGAFGTGMMVAAVFARMELGGLQTWTPWRVRAVCLPVLALTGVGCVAAIAVAHQIDVWLAAIGSAAFILLVVEPTARRRPLTVWVRGWDWTPLTFMGRISLGTYLWHYPVMILLVRFGLIAPETVPGTVLNTLLVLGVSVLAGWLSFRFVEEPFMKPRSNRRQETHSGTSRG